MPVPTLTREYQAAAAAMKASNLLPFVYQDTKVGTGKGPNSRYMGGGLWEKRWHLPTYFRVSFWGGWISPVGLFYINLGVNSDNYTLSLAGVGDAPSTRWPDRAAWALHLGWIRVGYWQNYGGTQVVSPNPYTIRRIIFSLVPGSTSERAARRAAAVAEYFEDLFDVGRPPYFVVEGVELTGMDTDGPITLGNDEYRASNSRSLQLLLNQIRRGSA